MRRHLPLLAVLAIQQCLLWAVLLGNNPETTVTWDCVAGAMGYEALHGWSFSPLDSYDGILGGMFVASLLGLPIFAVFGVTGLSVKAVSALLCAALTTATWMLWIRHRSQLDALLASAAVTLVPPTVFISSLMLGHWHFTELIFETLCLLLLYRVVFSSSKEVQLRVSSMAMFGLLLGVALFNCFASLVFFPAFLMLLWAVRKEQLKLPHGLALAAGITIGSGPAWWKLFFHHPYGIDTAVTASIPQQASHVRFSLSELFDMFPGGGFTGSIHFDTVFGGEPLADSTYALSVLVTVGLFLGWFLMSMRVAPSLRKVLTALRPGRAAALPEQISPALLPPLMCALYGLAYILSELRLRPMDWWLNNPRDHAHLATVPWMVWLSISGALLLSSLIREWRSGDLPAGEWAGPSWLPRREQLAIAAALVMAVQLPSLAGITAMVRSPLPGASAGDTFRGHCWDAFGFYMAPQLRLDKDLINESCDRYGAVGQVECYRGGTWALGFLGTARAIDQTLSGGPSPLAMGPGGGTAAPCSKLPEPWQQECLRGVGWALASGGAGDVTEARSLAEDCDLLESTEAQRACWLGVGFPIGDHLSSTPPRLRRRLRELPTNRHQWIIEGAGAQVGRSYGGRAMMEAVCTSWGPEYRDSCLRGVDNSLSFRSTKASRTVP